MSADDVSMNAADDGAIILGGDGSAFESINQPTDNVIDEMNPPIANVAPVPKVDADDDVMADADAIMDDAISAFGNNIGSPSDVAVPTLPPSPLLEDPAPPMDDASVNLETIETYNGSLEALENEQSDDDGKNKTQRKRIKYKDQGV